jgi:predicted RNA-binding protein YlqC (UPF0109 family)
VSVDDPFGQRSPAPARLSDDSVLDAARGGSPDADLDDRDDADDIDDVDDVDDVDADDFDGNRAPGARAAAVAEYVATSFADHPDAIEIETRERGRDVAISIHADRGDVGRLIGRRGRVINAIRQVARAAGSIDGERVQLDIAED